MTAGVLGALVLAGGLSIQLGHDIATRAAAASLDTATEAVKEHIEASPGLLSGVLMNDAPKLDTLRVLEVTEDEATIYALTTEDDVLIAGIVTPKESVAMASTPGDLHTGLEATLEGAKHTRQYALSVWRVETGYEYLLTVR
ncbi:hypothetical protein FB468_2191 [Leucobacter komagatae]|uniref:Uncharacterized protein n=2 Tax=Leucobacter komagatae TaxID=55969 RepID=A0A542Y833_9MICO|nr:hypothetical protein FB468_2191 [Leucobacter komagatae]